jgi:hypothetical protein
LVALFDFGEIRRVNAELRIIGADYVIGLATIRKQPENANNDRGHAKETFVAI